MSTKKPRKTVIKSSKSDDAVSISTRPAPTRVVKSTFGGIGIPSIIHMVVDGLALAGISFYMYRTTKSLNERLNVVEQQTSQAITNIGPVPTYLKTISTKIQDLESTNQNLSTANEQLQSRLNDAETYISQLFELINQQVYEESDPEPQPRTTRPSKRTSSVQRQPVRTRQSGDDEECEGDSCPLPKRPPTRQKPMKQRGAKVSIVTEDNFDEDEDDLDAELADDIAQLNAGRR